jgi:tight adherence protein B
MNPLLAAVAIMLAAASAALAASVFLWRPVFEQIQRRLDMLAIGAPGARARAEHVFTPSAGLSLLARVFVLGMPRKWGVSTTPLTLLLLGLVAGALTWLVAHQVARLPVAATLPLALIAFWLAPNILAKLEQGKADDRFVKLFPDAIDMMVRMLRASLPVQRAIRIVAEEAPAPMNGVFRSMADRLNIGVSFEDALAIESDRIGLADFRFFAAAIALQTTTGGNIVTSLEILADIIHRRHAVQMKAWAATAEVRMSTYVLSALPLVVLGALAIVTPAYMAPLISDPRGNLILLLVGALLLAALLSMRFMMRSVASP